jgi:hypothetical protein
MDGAQLGIEHFLTLIDLKSHSDVTIGQQLREVLLHHGA